MTCVWIVSESSLPLASVTRVCHTCVRLPLWSGVASARTTPANAAAKKLVFDSSVAVFWPAARFTTVPAAPMVSANAISVPPCTAPVVVRSSGRSSSSATIRSFSVSTKRMPRCFTRPLSQSSFIEVSVAPEDAVLVERDAPLGGKIRGEPRAQGDSVAQPDEPWVLLLQLSHGVRESVAKPLQHLEERQVNVRELVVHRALEVAHELRQALGAENCGAPARFALLFFVVEAGGDRVVRVVHFGEPIRDGELLAEEPQPRGLVLGREPEPRAEVKEDI